MYFSMWISIIVSISFLLLWTADSINAQFVGRLNLCKLIHIKAVLVAATLFLSGCIGELFSSQPEEGLFSVGALNQTDQQIYGWGPPVTVRIGVTLDDGRSAAAVLLPGGESRLEIKNVALGTRMDITATGVDSTFYLQQECTFDSKKVGNLLDGGEIRTVFTPSSITFRSIRGNYAILVSCT